MITEQLLINEIHQLPENLKEEVLKFIDFLKFKQQIPNQTTIESMQAANRGEYETVSLNDLKKQWDEA
jgi:hypothetical protein